MNWNQQRSSKVDVRVSTTNLRNSIFILENLYSGVCETLETPNIFLFSSILSLVTILIWSSFILERFFFQVKVVVALFNLESLFVSQIGVAIFFLRNICFLELQFLFKKICF